MKVLVIISHDSDKNGAYWGGCMDGSEAVKTFPDLNLIAASHLNRRAVYVDSERLDELIAQAKKLRYYVHLWLESDFYCPIQNED